MAIFLICETALRHSVLLSACPHPPTNPSKIKCSVPYFRSSELGRRYGHVIIALSLSCNPVDTRDRSFNETKPSSSWIFEWTLHEKQFTRSDSLLHSAGHATLPACLTWHISSLLGPRSLCLARCSLQPRVFLGRPQIQFVRLGESAIKRKISI